MSLQTKAIWTLAVLALMTGLWHFVWQNLKNPIHYPISHITVSCPCQNITEPMIQSAISPFAAKGFFGIPLNALRNQLAGLPGVSAVMIHRKWPDTLNVQIQVLAPVALWGTHSLVSNSGIIFPRVQQAWSTLPQISAPDADAPQAVSVLDLAQNQLANNQLRITALTEEPYVSWSLQVSAPLNTPSNSQATSQNTPQANTQQPTQISFWMILGLDNLPIKLQRFSIAYPALINAQKTLSRVDLRYPNGIAVQ